MSDINDVDSLIKQLIAGTLKTADIEALQVALSQNRQITLQIGKYNITIGEGQDIHIGDRIYQGASAEAIRDIIRSTLQELQSTVQPIAPPLKSVDELVQEARARLHDDIQRLHGTMPLWGVDHWVPLGELFVDVNILEELSSSHRAELDDLWQDFSENPSYRSLDRIGLGRERKRVSGLEVLAKNTNLMVVGKPGSGKTTYLQRIVTECNAGNLQADKIPVLIRLRKFVDDGRSLSYSLKHYLEQCWQLLTAETQLVLKQGRSLVLLDGLDEVTGEDGKTIIKQIKQFARTYPQVQMVITCRTQSFSGEMDWKSLRFSFVEVADFNEPQVRSFAEHWFKTVMREEGDGLAKAREFLEQLFRQENKPIRELVITPILLSLTCAVFHQAGRFYSKRSKLYEEGLELLLEKWDKSREIERDEIYRDLSVERKLELLSYLAVKKFEQEQYVLFEQEEIEGYVAEFLGVGQRESRSVLRAIESQHGLLVERAQRVWTFSHLTFQEYLTAKKFVEQVDWLNLARHSIEKHWRGVIFLAFDMLKFGDELLGLIKQRLDNLIASDKNIQQFLHWINQKSGAIESSYKSPAVRACYFILELLAFDPFTPLKPLLVQAHLTHLDLGLDVGIDLGLDLKLYEIHALMFYYGLGFHLDFRHSFSLAVTLGLNPQWHGIRTDIQRDFNEDIHTDLEQALILASNADLIQELESLKVQLPPSSSGMAVLEAEWCSKGQLWMNQLQNITIKYRNIGHKWKFSSEQKNLLEQYYDANEFLVNCLNNSSVMDEKIREEIEELLLLPSAEIEKRKREKVE